MNLEGNPAAGGYKKSIRLHECRKPQRNTMDGDMRNQAVTEFGLLIVENLKKRTQS